MLLRLLGGLPGALKGLRALIDAEALPVKKNVVRGERDLEQIVAEVEAARASAPGAKAAAGRHANCSGKGVLLRLAHVHDIGPLGPLPGRCT